MPLEIPQPGFSFENCKRNAHLANNGFKPPKMTKTGTTICAVVFKDGVILGKYPLWFFAAERAPPCLRII